MTEKRTTAIQASGALLCGCPICVHENVILELLKIKASDGEPITYHRAKEIVMDLIASDGDLGEKIREAMKPKNAKASNSLRSM